jgi:hypothetical protein
VSLSCEHQAAKRRKKRKKDIEKKCTLATFLRMKIPTNNSFLQMNSREKKKTTSIATTAQQLAKINDLHQIKRQF